MEKQNYDSILINGHGFLGYYYLGLLYKLKAEGSLENIKNYIGCSVGSIICLFLILDLKLEEIVIDDDLFFEEMENYHFKKSSDINILKKFINKIISEKFISVPTLSDFYMKYDKEFSIGVYNIENFEIEYLSHYTNPSMLLTDAILYSCEITNKKKEFEYINPSFLSLNNMLDNFIMKENSKMLSLTFDEKSLISDEPDKMKKSMNNIINYENQKKLTRKFNNIDFIFISFTTEDFSDEKEIRYNCFQKGLIIHDNFVESKEKINSLDKFFNKGLRRIKK